MVAVRTCIGCRIRADASRLLRVVARDREVVPDPSATLAGRGAWVHPTSECVERAAKRRAFGRALRVTEALGLQQLTELVEQKQSGFRPKFPNQKAD
jgi:uncharacterized protein